MKTRGQDLADAFHLVALADHYMVGIAAAYTEDELDEAEQVLIDWSLDANHGRSIELALDLVEQARRDMRQRASAAQNPMIDEDVDAFIRAARGKGNAS